MNSASIAFILFTFLSTLHKPTYNIPSPSGKYSVGTDTMCFTFQDSLNNQPRYINVQLWYPAEKTKALNQTNYIVDTALIAAMREEQYLNIPSTVLDTWKNLITTALWKALLIGTKEKFPLLLLSHGFGMTKNNYSFLSIELASQGYIVAAIDHPGSGLTILPDKTVSSLTPDSLGPDHKVILFCHDASFVTDKLLTGRFGDHIDARKIAMIGHSLGGAAALNMNMYDKRIKAAVNLDGYAFGNVKDTGISIPFMAILQHPSIAIPDSMKTERRVEWQSIVNKSADKSYVVSVKGLMHFDFSDLPFLIPDSMRIKNGGTLPAERTHVIISALITTFLNEYVKQDNSSIDAIIKKYPEISYELK